MYTSSVNFHSYLLETLSFQLGASQNPISYEKFQYTIRGLVSEKDREALLIWVTDLCSDLKLSTATGLLACHYLDKFLSIKPGTQRMIYELIGLTALALASKFKEGIIFSPDKIAKMLGDRFSIDAITTTEMYMLQTLNWELSSVTACDLVESICEFTFGETVSRRMLDSAFSFAALCYSDLQLAHSGNFIIAVSSILLALKQLRHSGIMEEWLETLGESFVVDKEKLEVVVAVCEQKIEDYCRGSMSN